ncbi:MULTISPECIES: HXXEE domain-containing protein [unclassified Microbacterium]|uniref:HXXEE domain-containing protein n=1 Tax=unclassified Microbacterium TaxID=2609290 RepID=UPI003018F2F8
MRILTRACLGLFVAWAVHDAEELVTMSHTSRAVLSRLPRRVPVPADLRASGVSQTHVNLAIAIMGAIMAAVAAAGAATGGRSPWFRGALWAFGAHGFTHLAASVVRCAYTPGVVTAPVVVIPFWLWARRVLRDHGRLEQDAGSIVVAISAAPAMFAVHALTRAVLGSRSVRQAAAERADGRRRGR